RARPRRIGTVSRLVPTAPRLVPTAPRLVPTVPRLVRTAPRLIRTPPPGRQRRTGNEPGQCGRRRGRMAPGCDGSGADGGRRTAACSGTGHRRGPPAGTGGGSLERAAGGVPQLR